MFFAINTCANEYFATLVFKRFQKVKDLLNTPLRSNIYSKLFLLTNISTFLSLNSIK